MNKNVMDLISRAKEITASGLPFMDGKVKVDFADNEVYTVKEYGYLSGDNGEFVVLTNGDSFAYGGSVVTEAFQKLDKEFSEDEIQMLLNDGIPMKISKKKSKNGRKYTTCEFFPAQERARR
jgi:Golgi nucleoside diphosphatase